MLLSTKSLIGYKLHESDSLVGEVHDLYFDDNSWDVKHLVAQLGGLWRDRKVLVAHKLLGKIDPVTKMLMISQTGDEVQHDPGSDTDKPLFEQVKEQSTEYYMWAAHWTPYSGEPEPQSKFVSMGDSHLRSVRHLIDHRLELKDGFLGYLYDFLVEDDGWHIPQMVVEVTSEQKERYVVLPTSLIGTFHCEEKTIDLDAEKADIREVPLYQPEKS